MIKEEIYQKIEDIAQKIGEKFHPDKIILFGSYAWGEPGPDSDVDLFIVKEMPERRIDRARKIRKIIWDSGIPIDLLVYTPKEIKRRLDLEDFFIEDVIDKGKVLYSSVL